MFLMLLLSAITVGLSLGLLGAGGAILTVPTLILLVGLNEKSAVASALIIVTSIAISGLFTSIKNRLLFPKVILWFSITSFPMSALGAHLGSLLPMGLQTSLLAIIMLFSALRMRANISPSHTQQDNHLGLLTMGAIVGLITGVVGIGGGFLIVPTLILYAGLTMQQAVANSLALIAINGSVGFLTLRLSPHSPILDWTVIAVMAVVGSLGVLIGQKVASRLAPKKLKEGFATLLMAVASALIIKLIFSYYYS